MSPAGIIGLFILILALYCGTDPFKHSPISYFPDFVAYKIELPPWSELPVERDTKNLLQSSEIFFRDQVQGPESLAFDPLGRGPYTGVADGRVLFFNGETWVNFAYTSANRSGLCNHKPLIINYWRYEHICGRPLGLRFDKRTGDLYIADAYFGLMKVGPEGGLAKSLTNEAEGVPLKFTNDLDIDEDGNVYFTDSSTKYHRRNFMQAIFSAEGSGRLLKYNPITRETTVLMRNLHFPNGVSLSKDGSFFIFCEGIMGRLMKYWLKGDKAGSSEVFAVLPGFPDNVRTNENGEFWVAMHSRRSLYGHVLAHHPKLRMFMLRLPIPAKIHGGRSRGLAVKYSGEGKILKILEDDEGKVVKAVSEVDEKDGKLWIGSVVMSFIALYNLD